MKYLWIGLAMIFLAYGFSLVNSYYLNANLSEIIVQLDIAEDAVIQGDNESALTAAKESVKLWEQKKQYYFSVLRHDSVERIGELLTLTARGIECQSAGVKDAIIDARSEIASVIASEGLGLGNVL